MKLGVKAHYRDVGYLKVLRPEMVEIFTHAEELKKPGLTREAFRIWGSKSLIHAPIYLDRPEKEFHLVDLASPDPGIRKESIEVVVDSCRLAAELDSRYVIIHPGGVLENDNRGMIAGTRHSFREEMLVNELSMNFQFSMVEIGAEIEGFYTPGKILLENMPYHFQFPDGRKWYPQLLLESSEFEDIMGLCGGICLDICHAYLARPSGGYEVMERFLERYGKRIHHLHISDARAPDGEGLQIGEGELGFNRISRKVKEHTDYRNLTGIPEVKDGHLKRGTGFHIALDRLRTIF